MIVPRSALGGSFELDVEVASQAPSAKTASVVVLDPEGLGIGAALAHAGYDVRSGLSGVEVLSLLAARTPSAIVCGPGDLRRLVAATVKARFPSVRVVYVDARDDAAAAARANAEGAHHAMPWPPTTLELHGAVPLRARAITAVTSAPVAMASSLGPSRAVPSTSAFASFDDDPDGSTGALRDVSLLTSGGASIGPVAPLMASSSIAEGHPESHAEEPPRTSGGAMMGSVFGSGLGSSSGAALPVAVLRVPSSSQAPPTGRIVLDDIDGTGANASLGAFGERTVEVRNPTLLPSHALPDAPRASVSGEAVDDDPVTLSLPGQGPATSQLSASSGAAPVPPVHELAARLDAIARKLERSMTRDGAADAQALRHARDALLRVARGR